MSDIDKTSDYHTRNRLTYRRPEPKRPSPPSMIRDVHGRPQPMQPVLTQSNSSPKPISSTEPKPTIPILYETIPRPAVRSLVEPKVQTSPAEIGKTDKDKPRRARLRPLQIFLLSLAIILFGFGIYIGVSGLKANHQVASEVHKIIQTSPDKHTPSTAKPTSQMISKYSVSPDMPRYIDIPKFDSHSRILSMGVDSHNQLQAPYNIFDTGWYNSSALPGQSGAMLIDGHTGIGSIAGVFHNLNKLVAGDAITITRGDGQQFTYKVVKSKVFDATKVDMASLLVSEDSSKPGLNLISCSGDVIPGTIDYNQRIVVYAALK